MVTGGCPWSRGGSKGRAGFSDPADVRGLVQDDRQGRVEAAAEPLGAAFRGAHRGVDSAAISGAAADRDFDSR